MFRSKWLGLWRNNDSTYACSQAIDKSVLDLKSTFRIVLKQNTSHKSGDNRPCYVFAFADMDNASKSNTITSKDLQYEGAIDDAFDCIDGVLEKEPLIRVSDAIEVARNLVKDSMYGYSYDDLSVEVEGFMIEKAITSKEFFDNIIEMEETT